MAPALELDDVQRFTLMKFRRDVADVLKPEHNEKFLLRWLRARNWNPEAAEKMLRDSMKWRQLWDVDGSLRTWKPKEPLATYYPSGPGGYDKHGAPVVIVPFAGLDMWGLLHSCSKEDLVRLTAKILEEFMEDALKRGGNQIVVIFDMEGFSLRQYVWRPAGEVVISLIQMYEANYPEILRACYIINAPKPFSIAFSITKKFMNEHTISKIQIFNSDRKKWQPVIRESVDVSLLPKHYGGDYVDEDGNPKCPKQVRQGGKIPKSMYTKKCETKGNFVTTVVKKGDKVTMHYIVADPGCYLKWTFRTEGHDIRFGVNCVDEDGNTSVVVKPHRVSANQIDEVGLIACQAPATYVVIFDNTYSYLRNKKLHYNIYVTLPLEKLEITTVPGDIETSNQISTATTGITA